MANQLVAIGKAEFQLLSELDHPHIVRCLGTEVQEGKAVIAMEFCAGGSLMATIKAHGRLEHVTIVPLFRQVVYRWHIFTAMQRTKP